ncbi:MAG: LPS-assembly protein LptD [Acidobacteriia bacterium]|nr:LPS-assembly protein LptD [Terriglobia bacterium]
MSRAFWIPLAIMASSAAPASGQLPVPAGGAPPTSQAPFVQHAVEIRSLEQRSDGPVRVATGDVELRFKSVVLTADIVEYNESTGDLKAEGNIHYRTLDGDQDLRADKLAYNLRTELGTFYEARGRAASASQGGPRLLTTDNPFQFEAPLVIKAGQHYTIHDGTLTNCNPDSPWWTLSAAKSELTPGGSAIVRNGLLRLRGVPLLYMPYFRKSLKRMPRQSGFLTPTIGNSSRFGRILGQAYYWAINRSYDATVGATLYTARGLATNASLRGRPTKNSSFDAVFFDVRDRGRELDDGGRLKQGGNSFDMRGQVTFGEGWRGVADLHYLSSLEFRQAFTQTYEEAVFSQIRSIGFVSKNFSTYSFNVSLLRNEHFQSVARDDNIVIRKLPAIEFNSRPKAFGPKSVPLWFSFDSSLDLISRTQRSFQTRRFVQRGMFFPRVSSRLSYKGLTVTPTLGARAMAYGQRRTPDGLAGENLYRRTGEFSVDFALPALERIYRSPKWLGDRVKHVIEPRVRYRYTRGIEDFDSVIRFDAKDLIHNTNEAEISLTNRLYSKNDSTGRVREIASLEVWQRRYFEPEFGGAIVPGYRNVLRSTLDFSSFAFLSEARNYSPIATSLNLSPANRWTLRWRNDLDPLHNRILNTMADATVQVNRKIYAMAGHRAVRVPRELTPASNQLLMGVRYGDYNRRGWNATLHNVYDYRQGVFLYAVSQLTYNTDCCGFSVELRRLSIGNTRSDNQIRISLAIANVGSFGTVRPAERMF